MALDGANPSRIVMSEDVATLLMTRDAFAPGGGDIQVEGQTYTALQPVARGYKGVVWLMRDRYGDDRAVKIATAEDYVDRSFHEEVRLRLRLPNPPFTRFIAADYWETLAIPDSRFVVTVEDWVEGVTLNEFLRKPSMVTTSTLLHFARGMCGALAALERAGLAHDDLHDKNIMLRPVRPGEGYAYGQRDDNMWTIMIVDTGSLKERARAVKPIDDVGNVARHLVAVHNVLRCKRDLTIADRRFLRLVRACRNDLRPRPVSVGTHRRGRGTRA